MGAPETYCTSKRWGRSRVVTGDKQYGITNPRGVKEKAEDNCVRSKLIQPAAESASERHC